MSAPRRISILAASGFALLAAVVAGVGGFFVGEYSEGFRRAIGEAIAGSYAPVTEARSRAAVVAELGKTTALGSLAATPLRVEELRAPQLEWHPVIKGRALRLWCRVENRSDGQAITPFSTEPSSFYFRGDLRDEFGNQTMPLGPSVLDEHEETDQFVILKPGDSQEKAIYATWPPVDKAQRFVWDLPFMTSNDGTVETLRVSFDRASIQPAGN